MAAGFYWFRMVDGEDFIRDMTYLDDDGVTPVDLTGYTAEFDILLGGSLLITVTTEDGIVLGGAAGTISVKVAAATFAAAEEFSTANYRLLLADPAGDKNCLLYGQFSIEGET